MHSRRTRLPARGLRWVEGYARFVEAIRDPAHEEHQEMLDWVGGEFDPEAFDPAEVNEPLAGAGDGGRS